MAKQRETSGKPLRRAKQMRKAPSDAERVLWHAFRNRRLAGLKFRRQVPIADYIADFACDEVALVVEVDGDQHGEQVEYDERRTEKLNGMGWRVVRFTASEVVRDLNAILKTTLRESGLADQPSP